MVKILVSLGSNIYSKQNIDRARRMLAYYFPDVVFTRSIITTASDGKYPFPFRNVLAVFHSDLPLDEVIQKLKMIEFAMGRQPRDKDAGKVIIDIDLLQYGDEIVRPDDYERAYVQSLLTQLIS
jgi:2-amino-4-hydroxy-6-hydroxymethyldihydropteridine diphosphokinase